MFSSTILDILLIGTFSLIVNLMLCMVLSLSLTLSMFELMSTIMYRSPTLLMLMEMMMPSIAGCHQDSFLNTVPTLMWLQQVVQDPIPGHGPGVGPLL